MNIIVLALFIFASSLSLNCMEDPKLGSKNPESQLQGHNQPSFSYSQEASIPENTIEPSSVIVTMGAYHRTIPLTQARSITFVNGQLDCEPESKTASLGTFKDLLILNKLLAFDLDYSLKLTNKEVASLFKVADKLGFKPETLRQLTLRAKKQLPPNQQSRHIRGELYRNYLNSINSLINNDVLNSENNWNVTKSVKGNNYTLDLSNLNLDNLDGFERLLTHITVPIHKLILDDNSIKLLNVELLLQCCPKLNSISAQNNNFDELLCPKQLPDRFNLILKGSTIQRCSPFKMGEASQLTIEGATISQRTEALLHQAVTPPFYKRYRHHLKTLKDCLNQDLQSDIPLCAAFSLAAITFSVLSMILNKDQKDPSYYFLGSLVFIGFPPILGIIYGMNYQNNIIHRYKNSQLIGINQTKTHNTLFRGRFLKRCHQNLTRYV